MNSTYHYLYGVEPELLGNRNRCQGWHERSPQRHGARVGGNRPSACRYQGEGKAREGERLSKGRGVRRRETSPCPHQAPGQRPRAVGVMVAIVVKV